MVNKAFGELLKELREARGYSMNQLAQKSGIDVSHISRLENMQRSVPKPETIKKIALVLGHYDDLMLSAGHLSDIQELGALGADGYIKKYGFQKLAEATREYREKPRPVTCGRRIKDMRDALDMSREDLAARAGVDPTKLVDYEEDKEIPPAKDLEAIADVLGLVPAFFVVPAEEAMEVDDDGLERRVVRWKHRGYTLEDIDKILDKWEAILEITKMSNNGEE